MKRQRVLYGMRFYGMTCGQVRNVKTIMSDFGDELLAITKNIALEGFHSYQKSCGFKKTNLSFGKKVRHILLPKDYLGYWLTGTMHMDYSDAAVL